MVEYAIFDIDEIINTEGVQSFGAEPGKGLAGLEQDEVKLINERLKEIAPNDQIFAILWLNREKIYEAVRAVKSKTGSPFKGRLARGRQLDLALIDPMDIKKSGTTLTSFMQTVSAGTTWYESNSGDEYIELQEEEARVYMGWADPVSSPKAVRVLYDLPENTVPVRLPFDLVKKKEDEYPIIMHEPVVLKPKDKYRIKVKYIADGTDALRPIGVIIQTASYFNNI